MSYSRNSLKEVKQGIMIGLLRGIPGVQAMAHNVLTRLGTLVPFRVFSLIKGYRTVASTRFFN